MKRKILSLILVFAMTVSLFTVGTGAVEPTYGDTAGHWAESSIERWSGHGIIQGSNGLFDPNGQLTCAQLATILAKLLKLPAAKDAGFTDNTADAWYYDAINRCAAAGILNGNGDGTVTPEAPISRERAMVMLARALGIEPIRKPDLTKYTDAAQVSAYAQGYVAALIEAGIVGGVTADELAPQDNINRASTVTILDRAISTYADKAGATVKADGKGIVLVVAENVTVTGSVDKLLVPANDIEVTVKGSKNIDDITVSGDNSKVILDNASADNVTLDGEKSAVETKNGAKIDNVIVTENAPGATVDVGSGTTVGNVENHAEDATVTGSGTVKKVESDKDITVKTKDTDVKNIGDEKITVTDKSGKDTTIGTTGSGSSTTVNKGTTSSGGGGYSHSHSYADAWSHDATHHWHASTCGHNLKIDEAAHTFTYADNGNGTHTKSCSACSYSATEAHSYDESNRCVCGLIKPAENVLASVKQADGTCTYYSTLPGAIAAAADGATITLLNNVELSAALEISAGKTVTLDLNGKKLSTTTKTGDDTRHYYAIDNYGVFTLLDSSAEQTGEIRARGIENLESGKMVIESGTIVAIDTNGGAAVWNKADLTINGGVFKAEYEGTSKDSYGPGCVYSEGTVLVTGGAFESANKRTYAFVSKTGSVTITPAGGKTVNISGAHGGLSIDGGTAIINGGNYSSSEYYGLYVSNDSREANVTVNDGSFTGKNYSVWIGSDVKNPVDSTLTINGGTFNKPINEQNNAAGKLKVTGGSFSSDPSEYVADGYIARENNGKYVVSMVGTAENPYTLNEFNALTKLPAGRDKLYVDLGNASLQNGLTIGNDKIADHYYYGEPNSTTAPEGFPHDTGRTDNDNRHIYSTGKDTVTVVVTGSVTGASDTGDFNAGAITLKVPDAANVIFDTVTFGEGQMAMSMWTESHVQSMTVSHRLASVTFNGCTFKGNWLQNGAFGADEMTITGCTFEKHENTAGINSDGFNCMNNSNPIWIQNMGQTNVTIEGCTINAVRPIKLWEGGANGSVTIRGNTFNMEKCSIDDDNTHKNIAIMFCGTTEQVKLGNVEISGNTVTGDATSLICFYNGRNAGENHYPAMNEGATFSLYNNILPEGTALSVIWKTATVWAPTYVPIPQ